MQRSIPAEGGTSTRSLCIPFILVLLSGCAGQSIDLGTADQTEPPADKVLKVPENAEGIATVGLRATVNGKLSAGAKGNVYVLVNPLSNPKTQNVWWVQQEVQRDGDSFSGSCQFGERSQGECEFFAIVAVLTDKTFAVGERLSGIPAGMKYTQLRIVKRSR